MKFWRDNSTYDWGLWQVSMPATSFNLSCTLQLHEIDLKVESDITLVTLNDVGDFPQKQASEVSLS